MAITITRVRRPGGAGCDHLAVDLDVDGQAHRVVVERDEVIEFIRSAPYPPDVLMALLVILRAIRRGQSVPSLDGTVLP